MSGAMEEMFARGWDQLIARDSGPLHIRLILQPLVATILAIRAGWRDAGQGRPVFFWTVVRDPAKRRFLLRQGWKDVGTLFLVACVLDVIYQVIVLHGVYAGQLLIVAGALAVAPYLVFRGLANRVAARIVSRRPGDKEYARMDLETTTKPAPVPDQAKLALERTIQAEERTLLAWVRTATSLITFGFTLYKFFFFLHEQEPGKHEHQLIGPRTYGLIMIGIGVFALAGASWQHWRKMKELRPEKAERRFSLSLVLAGLMGALGMLGFITTILNE
jgi:uncharacterized membrane protein YidH (DUF202 family)